MKLNKDHKFFARPPWDHQLQALTKSFQVPGGFAFFFEPGLGKTFTCISKLRLDCMEAGTLQRILIVAPVIVLENWRKEVLEFSKFPKDRVQVVFGSKTKRVKAIEEMGGGGIVITNYNSLSSMPDVLAALLKWKPNILVLDESHRCKNLKSKQTKAAVKISKLADKKYLLTGTPILNSLQDIFAQFLILDGGEALGKSMAAFMSQYFFDKNRGMPKDKYFPNWVEKAGAKKELHGLIAPKSMFMEKSVALDLPPLVRIPIEVELKADAKKAYKDMLKDFIAFIGEIDADPEAAVANLVLTRGLRLQQITSGFVNTETADGIKGTHRFKNNPKKEALKELLSDLAPKSKVIVWSVFKENYADVREVCDSLKLPYVEVNGSRTKSEKDESVRAFNDDEEVRVLSGHPASGGIGINLVSSNVSIFYSRSFSLEDDIQAEARNYRGGSEVHQKVTRYDIVAKDTIDIEVLSALKDKKSIGLEVLKGMV